jgi:hypothetical protein
VRSDQSTGTAWHLCVLCHRINAVLPFGRVDSLAGATASSCYGVLHPQTARFTIRYRLLVVISDNGCCQQPQLTLQCRLGSELHGPCVSLSTH